MQYVNPRYLQNELDKLEYTFNQGRYKDDRDWFEQLHDPRIEADESESRFYEQHHNELVNHMRDNYGQDDL